MARRHFARLPAWIRRIGQRTIRLDLAVEGERHWVEVRREWPPHVLDDVAAAVDQDRGRLWREALGEVLVAWNFAPACDASGIAQLTVDEQAAVLIAVSAAIRSGAIVAHVSPQLVSRGG